MILAGFQQEAGFYLSGGAAVALLAVPLESKPGPHGLTLSQGGGTKALTVTVAVDPYPKTVVRRIAGLGDRLSVGRTRGERARIVEARKQSQGPPRWNGYFDWPLAPPQVRTSPFGAQRVYNSGEAAWRHRGLDLRAAVGTPVLAPADGVVLLAEPEMAVSGGTLILGHGYEVSSAYYHLSRLDAAVGQAVKRGDAIGLSGATGVASGPHLHWEVLLRGHAVDPQQWLDPSGSAGSGTKGL
jgi:murein DD-endopeptidase MepM/ murein hydrolase activator NlpD